MGELQAFTELCISSMVLLILSTIGFVASKENHLGPVFSTFNFLKQTKAKIANLSFWSWDNMSFASNLQVVLFKSICRDNILPGLRLGVAGEEAKYPDSEGAFFGTVWNLCFSNGKPRFRHF